MKKALTLFVAIVGMCIALAACQCKHQYAEQITQEASCVTAGIKTFTCTRCKDSYTEEIPILEHTYTSTVTQEATCDKKGVTAFTCSACTDQYTEDIPMLAHTFGEAAVTKEPSCSEEGEKTTLCTVCGEEGTVEKLPKMEHNYKRVVKIAATCLEKGTDTLTCTVCNHSTESFVEALGHNYSQKTVVKPVSCTEDGQITVSCVNCKDSYTETPKATGHNWVDVSCKKAKHCQNCKLEEGEPLGHDYADGNPRVCNRCNEKEMSLTVDPKSKNTLTYYQGENNVTVSKVSVVRVWWHILVEDVYGINIKIKKTYDGSYGGTPSDVGFSFKLYDSNGNLVKQESVTCKNIRVGEEYYITYGYQIEPDAYTIILEDKIE